MAKIKITESQLKMIAKHKALNEMMDEPEENSKHYTMIWTLKGPTQVKHIEAPDPIVAYKKFMADVRGGLSWKQTIDDLEWDDIKLDELNGFKTVRESDLHGVVFYFDGFLSDDEIDDILDIVKKGEPGYESKNNRNANKKMDKPKEGEINESLSGWGDETESAVRKLSKVTMEDFNNMSDEQKSEMEFKMSHYDDNVYDFIIDQIGNVDENEIVEFAENNEEEFGTESQFVIFAIDDFCSVLGIEDNEEYDEDDEPIDYTMGRHDDENQLPNPPSEINLNEGQLLLKKVFNQFK
jgi:hypothetical protein